MSVIIILIIISILVALFFLAIFFWAVRTGQFDDTVSPSIRMLFDEKKPASSAKEKSESMDEKKDEGKKKND